MKRCRYRHLFCQTVFQNPYQILADTCRPKELLEVQGIHLLNVFVSDRHRLRFFPVTSHTEQRARGNDIESAVQLEKLQSRPSLRTLLNFIKNNDRISRNKH